MVVKIYENRFSNEDVVVDIELSKDDGLVKMSTCELLAKRKKYPKLCYYKINEQVHILFHCDSIEHEVLTFSCNTFSADCSIGEDSEDEVDNG